MKKILSLILSLSVLLTAIGGLNFNAFAAGGGCGPNAYYLLDETTGVLTVTGSGDISDDAFNKVKTKVITAVIEDGITTIGSKAFSGCSNMTSVSLPNTLKTISYYAFNNCSSLTSVEFPDSLTTIGSQAFKNCIGLTDVTISTSVKTIGTSPSPEKTATDYVETNKYPAFQGCSALTGFTVADDNAYYCSVDGVLFNKDKTALIQYPAASSVTEYTVPSTVKAIREFAFENAGNLTTVTFSEGLETIGYGAFNNCTGINSVNLPESVVNIGVNSFCDCSALGTVSLKSAIEFLGGGAFSNTAYYNEESNWENGVLYIGAYLINSKSDIEGALTVKDGTRCIAGWAFSSCASLTKVTLPNSVITICEDAFFECTALEEVFFGNGLKTIGDGAFDGCSLKTLVLPDSVETIGIGAFDEMDTLETAYLGKAVSTEYGEESECIFYYNCSLYEISVSPENEYYSTIDGVLFNKDKTKLLCYPQNKQNENYIIPESVTTLKEGAFIRSKNLVSVVVPSGVTRISNLTFSDCDSLKNVVLPDSLTSIGDDAFANCSALEEIALPESVTEIGRYAFGECTALKSIVIPSGVTEISESVFISCTSLTDVTLPESVTQIGSQAFSECTSLKSIVIPEGVETIKSYAFYDCSSLTKITLPKSLKKTETATFPLSVVTDVYYNGCEERWATIQFKNKFFTLTTIHYNEDDIYPDPDPNAPKVIDDVTYSPDLTVLIDYPESKTDEVFTVPDTVLKIEENAFKNVNLKIVILPASINEIGENAFAECTALIEIRVEENNLYFSSEVGVLFNKDKTVLIKYPCGRAEGEYLVPESVKRIINYAFANCVNLELLGITESVEEIENSAFENSAKTKICCALNSPAMLFAKATNQPYSTIVIEAIPAQVFTSTLIEPSLTVKVDSKLLVQDKDYSVKYTNNVRIGTASVYVMGKGVYMAYAASARFDIIPKTPAVKKIKPKRKAAIVKWKKVKGVKGYVISYSTSKKFKNAKTKTVLGASRKRIKIKKLKSKKKYYFRIRSFKTVKGKTYYSKWSKKKSVKTK